MKKVKYGWLCDTDFCHELDEDNIGYVEIFPNKKAYLKDRAAHFKSVGMSSFVCSPVKVKIEVVEG